MEKHNTQIKITEHDITAPVPPFTAITTISCVTKEMHKLTPCRQNLKVHHSIHKSLLPVPILSQLNPLNPSPRSILIPSYHLHLSLPSGIFPSGFPAKTLYTFLSSPKHATCPAHLILLYVICIMMFSDEYKLLCNFLHYPVTSYLLSPNIFLRTLFSNTSSLFSSLNVRDQVSHPYKTTGRIMILSILTFTFLDSRHKDKRPH
jgi:hypothetical protein